MKVLTIRVSQLSPELLAELCELAEKLGITIISVHDDEEEWGTAYTEWSKPE